VTIFIAIVLGLVQGITEFLPISSSGHLVIFSKLFGLDNNFTFDVLLNFGSLLAMMVYYRVRIKSIITRIATGREWALLGKLVLATLPAAIVGLLFNNQIEILNTIVWVVIITQIAIGIPMILMGKQNEDADNRELEKSMTRSTAIKMGIAQMMALIPGVSRSGITILAGLRSNLSVERAAEFSFLMAMPIILGASLKTLLSAEGVEFVANNMAPVLIGNVVCFIAGIVSIKFLIKLVTSRGLRDFGWYRIGLASLLIAITLLG
jgi:undecaprenyl-diphosphatase